MTSFFITFIFLLSFLINLKQFLLPFNFPEDEVVTLCTPLQRRWCLRTNPSPTQVMSPTRLLPHGDLCRVPHRVHDRATVPRATVPRGRGLRRCHNREMLSNAHREQVYHSQREGLSVGQSSSSVSDRSGQPVVERGQELNTEHAQIRTLLDRQREQILADCQPEIRRHEFQANYDRRSIQKLIETIESQREKLHRGQTEGLHRRDQQLLHEQLLKQNWDLREAHEKSLKELEELKKFQSSTFDTIARRRIDEYQDTILELTGKIQELQNEINCLNDSRYFQGAESVRSGHSLPR